MRKPNCTAECTYRDIWQGATFKQYEMNDYAQFYFVQVDLHRVWPQILSAVYL